MALSEFTEVKVTLEVNCASERHVLHANGREREAGSMQAEREGRPNGTRDYDRAQFLLPTAADADWERTEVVLMHF